MNIHSLLYFMHYWNSNVKAICYEVSELMIYVSTKVVTDNLWKWTCKVIGILIVKLLCHAEIGHDAQIVTNKNIFH